MAPAEAEPSTGPIEDIAPKLLDRCRRKAESAAGFRRPIGAKRHKLRIALKKTRYAVELLGSLYDPDDAKRFVQRLKWLQDDLGESTTSASLAASSSRWRRPARPGSRRRAAGCCPGTSAGSPATSTGCAGISTSCSAPIILAGLDAGLARPKAPASPRGGRAASIRAPSRTA